jgi:hypothetical protein
MSVKPPAVQLGAAQAAVGMRHAMAYRETALLQRIKELSDNVIRAVDEHIRRTDLSALAAEYNENLKKQEEDIGFNLFELISDHYYRETFHSDILHALLDPKGKHEEGQTFLNLFLEFISSGFAKINLSDYTEKVQVEKEKGKIDILIKGSGKAIIVENKINNAGDRPRQLPQYLEYVREMGYACDAIIYLRLNRCEYPDTTGWTPCQREDVKALLIIVNAYDDSREDLLSGWIRKCEKASTNRDTSHILRQYGDLIKKLGRNIMNKPIMEKFYKIVVEGENLKTALTLKQMLDDLVLYRVEKIRDRFKSDLAPFHKISNYEDADAYFTDCIWNDAHFGIDIWVYPESYTFWFWDRNDEEGAKGHARTVLQKMGCLSEYVYTCKDGRFVFAKEFEFPSEEETIIEHITAFKKSLGSALAET